MNRKEKFSHLISNHVEKFQCPKCSSGVYIQNNSSLVCENNHCFDLSKKGYINLLLYSKETQYNKELFTSRNKISKSGFFDELVIKISEIIKSSDRYHDNDTLNILDVGCGEGSHLTKVNSLLTEKSVQGIGIDIEKEAIKVASSQDVNTIWCVADLAQLPFKNKQFDFILNIFSPSNSAQFKRLLKRKGLIIKVIPNSDYLKELRDAFFEDVPKREYSNENVIDNFAKEFKIISKENLNYTHELNENDLTNLIKMTPLSWGISDEKIQLTKELNLKNITVDLTVIVGKPYDQD